MEQKVIGRRKKAILINIIILLIFLTLLGGANTILNKNISIYCIIIGVIMNFFMNCIIPSPGYYINKLKFDNTSIKKKIKLFVVNIIQSLFIVSLIINFYLPDNEVLKKTIGPSVLFIDVLNVLYLLFSKEQTFFEKIFDVQILDISDYSKE